MQIQSCQHLVCASCVRNCCEREALACPCNGTPIGADLINVPSPLIHNILGSLLIRCNDGCGQIMELKNYTQHRDSKCKEPFVPPPSRCTVQQLLDLQAEESTSTLRAQTTSLLLEKLVPSNGPMTCRSTSGKVPITIMY